MQKKHTEIVQAPIKREASESLKRDVATAPPRGPGLALSTWSDGPGGGGQCFATAVAGRKDEGIGGACREA